MYRSISIDNDVAAALEARRRHSGEDYNTVLRRIAGLDPAPAAPAHRPGGGGLLTAAQAAVADALAGGAEMTAAQLSGAAAISPAATGAALRRLERVGLARRRRVPGGGGRRWYDLWQTTATA